ncbi:hypothetical protein DBR42_14485, partial [Pelomonas sp. HMWF004]
MASCTARWSSGRSMGGAFRQRWGIAPLSTWAWVSPRLAAANVEAQAPYSPAPGWRPRCTRRRCRFWARYCWRLPGLPAPRNPFMPSATTLRALLALLTLAASAAHALTPALPPTQPPPPELFMPRFIVPAASQPLTLQRVTVQAAVAGTQAQTRIEIVVRNPNPRQLEATLEFPLAAGQSIVGFALDVRSEMVSAVPVPKDKGRQVFDDISRRRVDPALLERTAGNNFKLRIYPVPPNGERRVLLQLAETLQADRTGRMQYRLPLDFGQPVAQFDGRVDLRGSTQVQAAG